MVVETLVIVIVTVVTTITVTMIVAVVYIQQGGGRVDDCGGEVEIY